MTIMEAQAAPARQTGRLADAVMRSIPAVMLFAALYSWAAGMSLTTFRWTQLLAGAALTAAASLGGERAGAGIRLTALALLASALALVPDVRTGAGMACNALFAASEEINRYAYVRIALPAAADPASCGAAFGWWLTVTAAVAAKELAGSRSAGMPLLAAAVIAAAEVYFGVAAATGVQLLVFGCLGLLIVKRAGHRPSRLDRAAAAVLAASLALAVGLLLPGVNPALESCSERLRDWLAMPWPGGTAQVSAEDTSVNRLRQESLLTGTAGGPQEEQTFRAYERQQQYRQDVSDPRTANLLRTVLLLALVVAVLVAPFLPFMWLDWRKRKALARRAAFGAQNPAEAIAAMFRHLTCCLTAAGVKPDPRGFALLEDPAFPAEYWTAYREGAALWQEAVYSEHPMTMAQKEQIAALLKQTQQLVYERAGRRQRFRLQYVDGLILTEDLP
ncbi:MAG: hypothetical protein ACI4O7_14005 [Aristaeellaceae bacterium]